MKETDIASRVPPGQFVTTSFPILHHGEVPHYRDMSQWNLRVFGLVEEEVTFTFDEFMSLPRKTFVNDIHCVTTWTRLDNVWEGVAVSTLMERVRLKPEARFVMLHAEHGWTTNLPLEDFLRDTSFFRPQAQRRNADAQARVPRPDGGAAPVFLEKRQMAARHRIHGRKQARLLGAERVPYVRRSVAFAKVRYRLKAQAAKASEASAAFRLFICAPTRKRPVPTGSPLAKPCP